MAECLLCPSKLIMCEVTKFGSESLKCFIGLQSCLHQCNGVTVTRLFCGVTSVAPSPPPLRPTSLQLKHKFKYYLRSALFIFAQSEIFAQSFTRLSQINRENLTSSLRA